MSIYMSTCECVQPAGALTRPYRQWASGARVCVCAHTVRSSAATCLHVATCSTHTHTMPLLYLFTSGCVSAGSHLQIYYIYIQDRVPGTWLVWDCACVRSYRRLRVFIVKHRCVVPNKMAPLLLCVVFLPLLLPCIISANHLFFLPLADC